MKPRTTSNAKLLKREQTKSKRLLKALAEVAKHYKEYLASQESSNTFVYRNKFLENMRKNSDFKKLFDNTRKLLREHSIKI